MRNDEWGEEGDAVLKCDSESIYGLPKRKAKVSGLPEQFSGVSSAALIVEKCERPGLFGAPSIGSAFIIPKSFIFPKSFRKC